MHRFHIEGFSKWRKRWILVDTEPDARRAVANAKDTASTCDCQTRVRAVAFTGEMIDVWPVCDTRCAS